jgi:zinc and cadmium transporter
MSSLFNILIATFLISLCVWVAIIFLYIRKELLKKITIFLVSLSAGALLGGAFLHLLPEAAEVIKEDSLYVFVLIAFIFFFLMEKVLHWRHCHKEDCKIHTFGYMNLFGNATHNFIDGLMIASTFLIDYKLGIITTLAIAFHEIPQEIGNFGVLTHAGFEKKTALIVNYLVSLTVIFGGITGYFLSFYINDIIPYLLPFAAGGFIYIAATDLIPEMRDHKSLKGSIISFLVFIFGILIMYGVKFIK